MDAAKAQATSDPAEQVITLEQQLREYDNYSRQGALALYASLGRHMDRLRAEGRQRLIDNHPVFGDNLWRKDRTWLKREIGEELADGIAYNTRLRALDSGVIVLDS